MRKSCESCVIKHLAQAEILFQEARCGYPLHFYLALGHIAEAEHEMGDWQMANELRECRIEIQESGTDATFDSLDWIAKILKYEESEN